MHKSKGNANGNFELVRKVGGVERLLQLAIAPEGRWGLRCNLHGYTRVRELPTKWHRDRYACPQCPAEDQRRNRNETPAVLSDAVRFVEDPGHVLQNEWHHVGEAEQLSASFRGITHVGTLEAARDRLVFLQDYPSRPGPFYRFEVRLKLGAKVCPNVVVESSFGGHLDGVYEKLHKDWDVVRYVNTQEAPGSISLAVRPSALASGMMPVETYSR